MDHQNIPGFREVDQLAKSLEALVEVDGLVLHSMQVTLLFELWRRLNQYDKGRTVPEPRFSSGEPRGRFRQTKASTMPGVEVARR